MTTHAQVYDSAQVFNAKVYGDAIVHGSAHVEYDVEDEEITE